LVIPAAPVFDILGRKTDRQTDRQTRQTNAG